MSYINIANHCRSSNTFIDLYFRMLMYYPEELNALNPLLVGNLSQISGYATARLELVGTHIKP